MDRGRLQADDGRGHDGSRSLSSSIASRCSHRNSPISIFIPGFECPIVFL